VTNHIRKAAEGCGGPVPKGYRFGLHNLRPSLSNWMVNKGGVQAKTVQGILGHSRIQTTLDLYTQGHSDEIRASRQSLAIAGIGKSRRFMDVGWVFICWRSPS
jgi:integrase